MADFFLSNQGSIALLTPLTEAGKVWADEHLNGEETQHWGRATVIEPRYVQPIVEGIEADGLTISNR